MERKGIDQKTGRVSTAGMRAEPGTCSFVNSGRGGCTKPGLHQGDARSLEKAVFNCFCVFIQNMNTDF